MSTTQVGFRIVSSVVAGVVVLAGLTLLCTFAFGWGNWLTAPFRGEADERERTTASGAFRVTTYEDFFDLCSDVQDKEGTISLLEEERRTASPGRRATIDSSLTALRAARLSSIHEYNSKAAQEHRAAFQDHHLPSRLDADGQTECAP